RDGGARAGTTALPIRTPTATFGNAGGNGSVAVRVSTAGSRVRTARAGLAATDGRARARTRRSTRGATALPVRTPAATFGTAGGNGSVAIGMSTAGSRGHTPRAGLAA